MTGHDFIEFSFPENNGAVRGILTTIVAGDMGPAWDGSNEARKNLLSSLRIAPERTVTVRQEHTRQVWTAEEAVRAASMPRNDSSVLRGDSSVLRGDSSVLRGDGLVTKNRNFVLGVTVADCLPIFLYDTKDGAFGIVHSGWKGTGIAVEALRRMKNEYGTNARDICAVIGPGIGACCYRVDAARAEHFAEEFGDMSVLCREGGYYLDLKETNRLLLERAGVGDLTVAAECTSCSPRLGSYRRQGTGSFIRMIALIGFF